VLSDGTLGYIALQDYFDAAEELDRKGRHEEAAGTKRALSLSIRERLRESNAIGYIMAGMSSVSSQVKREDVQIVHGEEPGKGMVRGMRPRFDPQHRKAITVNWEWKGDGPYKAGLVIQFFRREPGRIVIEESQSAEGNPTVGLFTGLLGG
jgi:hypothetical protein